MLLSITPTWCRNSDRMERTSFADAAVITLVNDAFVAIRVDPDRRPDIAARAWPRRLADDRVPDTGWSDARRRDLRRRGAAAQRLASGARRVCLAPTWFSGRPSLPAQRQLIAGDSRSADRPGAPRLR